VRGFAAAGERGRRHGGVGLTGAAVFLLLGQATRSDFKSKTKGKGRQSSPGLGFHVGRPCGALTSWSGGEVDAAHAEEVVAGVEVGGGGLGEVPRHSPELLYGSGDTEVRQGGWSTAARSSAPAQRIRRHW